MWFCQEPGATGQMQSCLSGVICKEGFNCWEHGNLVKRSAESLDIKLILKRNRYWEPSGFEGLVQFSEENCSMFNGC